MPIWLMVPVTVDHWLLKFGPENSVYDGFPGSNQFLVGPELFNDGVYAPLKEINVPRGSLPIPVISDASACNAPEIVAGVLQVERVAPA